MLVQAPHSSYDYDAFASIMAGQHVGKGQHLNIGSLSSKITHWLLGSYIHIGDLSSSLQYTSITVITQQ